MVKRTSVTDASRERITGRVRHIDQQTDFDTTAEPLPLSALADATVSRSIVIIEKRALIRDCLRRCFKQASDLDIIAVSKVDEWLEMAPTTSASLVIVSIAGSLKSPEAQCDVGRLVQGTSARPTVVLSDGDELEQIIGVLDSGARGYIPTDLTLDVAIEAVRLVRAGGVFVPASSLVAARRTGDASNGASPSAGGIFTARQAAVVDALRRGKANKVIAYELKMRESTVKVHVRNIMKKLNAKNRTEVAFMANELIKTGDGHAMSHVAR
jgi:DNA-binding NarL/FixJ family response regulator